MRPGNSPSCSHADPLDRNRFACALHLFASESSLQCLQAIHHCRRQDGPKPQRPLALQVRTPQQYLDETVTFFTATQPGRSVMAAGVAGLAVTLAIAVQRVWQQYNSSRNLRLRQLDKNKAVVEELGKFLPGNRATLNKATVAVSTQWRPPSVAGDSLATFPLYHRFSRCTQLRSSMRPSRRAGASAVQMQLGVGRPQLQMRLAPKTVVASQFEFVRFQPIAFYSIDECVAAGIIL